MHTCSHNSVLGIPEFLLQQQEGPAEGEDLEEAVNATISTLSKKLSAKWKANNNVSKLYLRKSQRKIQDQGFYFVFLSSNHRKYLEELETTFCGEFHRTGKSQAKLEPKTTEIVEISEFIIFSPVTLTLRKNKPERVSQLDGGLIGLSTHICWLQE